MFNPPALSKKTSKAIITVLVVIGAITFFAPLLYVARIAITGTEKSVAGKVTPQQVEKAEKAMQVKFPASTKFLLFHREMDVALFLKVEIPKSDLAEFTGQPTLKSAKWRDSEPLGALDIDPAWKPDKAFHYRVAEIPLADRRFLDVEVDDDSADPKSVYLAWSAP